MIPRFILEEEIKKWLSGGLISKEQSEKILSLYPETIPSSEAEKDKSGKLISVFSILGSILVGLGVILFFAANWSAISKPIKLILIFGAIISVYALGYFLKFVKGNYPKTGTALLLLGAMFYGSGIWLIAQIFNISVHYPDGVLWWAIGLIPLVYITLSNPVLCLTSFLFTLWLGIECIDYSTVKYHYFFWGLVIVLPLTYKMLSRTSLFFTLGGIVFFFLIAPYRWFESETTSYHAVRFFTVPLILLFLGIFIYLFGTIQSRFKGRCLL
ncbi:MAG: DUF2157 domain-containing protein [Candidatus Hydrogenedentota bacterium]